MSPPSSASATSGDSPDPEPNVFPSRLTHEEKRQMLFISYGLNSYSRRKDVDEIARIARAIFHSSVLVTAVLGTEVITLGKSLEDEDLGKDFTRAVMALSPVASLAAGSRSPGRGGVLVVDDAAFEMQTAINGVGQPVGFYAFAPLLLPVRDVEPSSQALIAVGGFIVISPHSRPAGSFSLEDQSLLASLSNLVVKELQRGHDEIRRQRRTDQAAFVGKFLELALTGKTRATSSTTTRPTSSNATRPTSSGGARVFGGPRRQAAVPESTLSPAMASIREVQNGRTPDHLTFAGRNGYIFDVAITELCAIAPGMAALILDLRAFSASSLEQDSRQPKKHLQPITVLASRGFGEVESLLTGQEELSGIQAAIRGWRKNLVGATFRADGLSFLLPASSQSSLSIPILDHTGLPVLLILMSSPQPAPMGAVEEPDKVFIRNVGQLCLSTLLKDRAVKADRAKLAFVSQIAHELRTPIHGLGGQITLIRDEVNSTASDAEKYMPLLKIADICLDSLRAILDDTLDFAKLSNDAELGMVAPLITTDSISLPVFLEDLTKATWARKLRSASSAGGFDKDTEKLSPPALDVIFNIAGRKRGWDAIVNSGELRRTLGNVLANAFTFTSTGFVSLELTADEEPGADGLTAVHLTISDSGVGMTPEFISEGQIFLPFVKGDTFSPGCGLGMAIVRDLVNRMRGTVRVESVLGQGTKVHLSLPIQMVDALSAPDFAAKVHVLSDELGVLKLALQRRRDDQPVPTPTEFASSAAGSPVDSTAGADYFSRRNNKTPDSSSPYSIFTPSPSTRDSTLSLRILTAEDNPIAQRILTTFLKKRGHDVKAVGDGEAAVEEFRRAGFRPDMSVLDIGMPKKDGLEAAFEIREIEETMGWPKHTVVALTALSSPEDHARGMGAGGPFSQWITKGGNALHLLDNELKVLQRKLEGDGK